MSEEEIEDEDEKDLENEDNLVFRETSIKRKPHIGKSKRKEH